MIKLRKREQGVTLFETILVLTLGAGIVYFSINQYLSYRLAADAQQIKYNVDVITQAATGFYQANCNINTTTPTVLDPATSASTVPLDIGNQLQNAGYLTQTIPLNPLVNEETGTWKGYTVRLIKTTTPRYACVTGTNATGTTPASGCSVSAQVGTILNWAIQTSVVVKNPAIAQQLKNMTGATCLSSLQTDGTGVSQAVNCSQAANYGVTCQSSQEGMQTEYNNYFSNQCDMYSTAQCNTIINNYINYSNTYFGNDCWMSTGYNNVLVFERQPSMDVTLSAQSGLWLLNLNINQFKQMYTTNPIANLTSGDHTTEYQYFSYCGN